MFLKSLEMVGFKSFADKTVIDFHQGMTAIVGPNGCGKSNVLDAIRWVLGEQSAKALRGSNMQDVIFNGTDARKSVGMAEISLTFINCEDELGTEYHEIRITRRVFRDGQSEYEINKNSCRLRDIQQLFMDTGIGRTAYSIMEQGKIDALLSSQPEDRRAVFEEAAGITRFKSQKKEAIRKLELTETNLLRVTDIIKEVNRQIGSLQRQASKARRYKETSEQLKQLDTKLASHQFQIFQSAVKEGEEKVGAMQIELSGLQQTLEEKEGFLRQKRMDLENLEDQIHSAEQQRVYLENESAQAKQKIEFNQQRISELEDLIGRNRLDIASTEEKIRFQQEQLSILQSDLSSLKKELSELSVQLQQQQKTWQEKKDAAVACTKDREKLESEISANARKMENNRARIAALEAQQRGHILRVEKLGEDEKSWETGRKEILASIQSAQNKLQQREEELYKANAAIEEDQKFVDAHNIKLRTRREKLETIQSDLAAHTARKEALGQLAASQTGYSNATRMLLEQYRGKGIRGTLLEHIRVKSGYERAIELCLGAAFETLILDDANLLNQLVAQLEGKGAAVFAEVSNLEESAAVNYHRAEAAIHFITAQSLVAGWIPRLLADCYIVENADAAQQLRSELPFAQIVTRDGQIWHPHGWQLRGQVREDHQSILTRDNELSELVSKISALELQIAHASDELEATRQQLETAENKLSESRQSQQKISAECNSARYELELNRKRDSEWQLKLQNIQREKSHLAEEDSSGLEEQKKLNEENDHLARTKEENTLKIEKFAANLAELNRLAEEQGQRVMDLRVRIAATEQRKEGLARQEAPIRNRLQELQENLLIRGVEIEEYQNRINESRQGVSTAEQLIAASVSRIAEFETTITTLSFDRKTKHTELVSLEENIRRERKQVSEVQTLCGREEIALAEKKMHLNALVDRVQRAYQVQLQDVASVETPVEENWSEIETQVLELREKLDRMGPVNLEAITEFEELEQRQKFLQTQESDLTQAKEQLISAIRKIDETTKVMFAETFEKIQTNFSQIFIDLFGGGRAALTLLDEQNPLESGIEIVAKPPGKQLQSITLLSGGEKTMTAVALLFAIYMVKPSPFCVLDEMDAPLDESNIARFIHMLQRFVQQSQFIVITHNKRTIAATDIIYGMTMEEHGVSKVVSVKLTRKDEDPLFNGDDSEARHPLASTSRGEMNEPTLSS